MLHQLRDAAVHHLVASNPRAEPLPGFCCLVVRAIVLPGDELVTVLPGWTAGEAAGASSGISRSTSSAFPRPESSRPRAACILQDIPGQGDQQHPQVRRVERLQRLDNGRPLPAVGDFQLGGVGEPLQISEGELLQDAAQAGHGAGLGARGRHLPPQGERENTSRGRSLTSPSTTLLQQADDLRLLGLRRRRAGTAAAGGQRRELDRRRTAPVDAQGVGPAVEQCLERGSATRPDGTVERRNPALVHRVRIGAGGDETRDGRGLRARVPCGAAVSPARPFRGWRYRGRTG